MRNLLILSRELRTLLGKATPCIIYDGMAVRVPWVRTTLLRKDNKLAFQPTNLDCTFSIMKL